MKKFLLPILMFFLTATGASAQSLSSEVTGKIKTVDVKNPVTTVAKINKGMKKLKSNEIPFGYPGCTEPAYTNPYAGLISGAAAQIVSEELGSTYAGYKAVGMGFAVVASLGSSDPAPIAFAVFWNKDQENGTLRSYSLPEGSYEVSTITDTDNGKMLEDKWNEIYFDEPYEITSDLNALRYGLSYDAVEEGDVDPILIGTVENTNQGYSFLVYVNEDQQWELGADDTQAPYTPCMFLILQDPNGEDAIIGVDKAGHITTPQQYFSANGARLSAPQKGLNIVKMSDGTTMKVVVK